MKNKILSVLLVIITFTSVYFIYNKYYIEKNIKIVENVEKDIKYDKNKPNIYLFWGRGCGHCELLNKFLYKNRKYFNLYSFETWYNVENKEFMDEVLEYMGEDYGGVPYLIIGDKSYLGFTEEDSKTIKKAIKDEYKKKNRVDIYKKLKESR